ncbi:MAG: L-lactate dehydrogenase [Nocardioides sp.]
MAVLESGKIAIVGAGSVGSSMAYACLTRGSARTIALYDVNEPKVVAEVLDLAHGAAFTGASEVEGGADPAVLEGAHVVVVTAGAKQEPGQTRLDLAATNVALLEKLMPTLLQRAPGAVFVLVTNPCDVLTVAAQAMSGLPAGRVLSSGTMLDSSRLRLLLAQRAGVSPSSVHAHIIGEHGDSEFAPWSQARIGPVPIREWRGGGSGGFTEEVLSGITDEVRNAAYRVIRGKGATNYAIGLAGARLVEAILRDEHIVAPVSTVHDGYRGFRGVAFSMPSIVTARGVDQVLDLRLEPDEERQLEASAEALLATQATLGL